MDILASAGNGGVGAFFRLPADSGPKSKSETEVAAIINAFENESCLLWWDFPEELAYWKSNELQLVQNYSAWTRIYDRDQRPNYMYMPGHQWDDVVAELVPYLDIISASCYTTRSYMPHAWVRWRVEETKNGIIDPALANCTLGDDYLNGEKILTAVVELDWSNDTAPPEQPLMTPEGAYHDFWQAIVSGAKGISIYYPAQVCDHPALYRVWDIYCRAASEVTGFENLDEVILSGTELSTPSVTYNSGTMLTPAFEPFGNTEPEQQYSSIDLLYQSLNAEYYLFTVSSATGACNATIGGLPADRTAEVLFEGRTVQVNGVGELTDDWAALGVHIYKIGRIAGNVDCNGQVTMIK